MAAYVVAVCEWRCMTIVIGLTGGIATGKSTVAAMLEKKGARIFNADVAAHRLMEKGGPAHDEVASLFPSSVRDGTIHRPTLGALVFDQPELLAKLEAILHPLVREEEKAFIAKAKQESVAYVVLEIPLLFESDSDRLCDITVTTDCPSDVQYKRAMERPHMSKEKFERIISHQMPQEERMQRADWVIPTGMSERETEEALASLLRALS